MNHLSGADRTSTPGRANAPFESGERETRSLIERTRGTLRSAVNTAKRLFREARAPLPSQAKRASQLARELEKTVTAHLRAHPRTDTAIVAGVSLVAGIFAGSRLIRYAIGGAAAYGALRLLPRAREALGEPAREPMFGLEREGLTRREPRDPIAPPR